MSPTSDPELFLLAVPARFPDPDRGIPEGEPVPNGAHAGPAPRREPLPSDAVGARAILNPFEVYREGDTVLRGQLNALDEGQLRNIIRQYQISDLKPEQLGQLNRAELVALIMTAVERRAA